MAIYPTKKHFSKTAKNLNVTSGIIYVRGGEIIIHPDSDTEYDFHQDSNFYYLSGVRESGFSAAYDISTDTAILFVNHISADESVWIGVPPSLEDYRIKHGFDEAHYTYDIETVLTSLKPPVVYTLPYCKTEQLGMVLELAVDREKLLEPLHEARVFKDEFEIDMIRRANRISGDAHLALMKETRLGMNEAELRGRFVGLTLAQGCIYESYGTIAARGRNASILHYTKNNQQLDDDTETILVDAGGTYENYASDITRTWPIGPKFSPECREIYQIVLDMQKITIDACAPHKQWEDMHLLSNRVAAEGLLRLGILKGSIEDIMEHDVVGYFLPHGIGHFLGIDTHDVGGYPKNTERIDRPGLRYLRVRREMLPNMVLTVEPGIYFVDGILATARADPKIAKHIDFEKVANYHKVGGVRIEDNIVITEDGCENLTNCPKEISELEAIRSAAYNK
ncbi:Xaa-Pro dipeptidase [Coemansia reversa NRRL 1564]|uniref:Xaa-Pro dipeptidase n=1 Tax=Coemansia reversa (strain ATCC 12441 / NRRL 1564) TaxID=763665 RepID=A0A2G5BAF9_COERN|nr:Xaa-Pro dipeptidase [Coemansia reversa NRRL 1564]|eukprot:PIA15995.1 Xaa-Pro dipeptidase [Coemansia reversa NRRL 1564]